jgi:hypothetical protein
MTLKPSTPGTGPEQEESRNPGATRGERFGDRQSGAHSDDESTPIGGRRSGPTGAEDSRGLNADPTKTEAQEPQRFDSIREIGTDRPDDQEGE